MKKDKWNIWHYIRSYKFNSIFIKTFFLILLPTIFPLILISTSIYNYNTSNIREQIKETNVNSLAKIRNMVDMMALESDKISSRLASDSDIQLLLSYKAIDPREFYTYEKFRDLYKVMSIITTTNDIINSVYVYFEESKFVFATDGFSMDLEHFPDKDWLPKYDALKKKVIRWTEPRIVNRAVQANTQHFISNFNPITNYNYDGVIVVNIDLQKLKKIVDNVNDTKQNNILIVDETGNILYNTDVSIINKNINEIGSFQALSLNKSESYFIKDVDGISKIVTVLESEYNSWKYIFMTPVSQYSQRTEDFKEFMFFSLFASLLISLIVAFLISIKVFQPIKNIISLIDRPQEWKGMLEIDDERNFNEFKYVAKGIFKSLDKTREMEEALMERLNVLRKAQSVALQAQINPHFLYNTMETINWKAMALTGGENEVSEMLSSLSWLLRLSLETENNLVTIDKEIQHAKLYLDIQKIRYKDKFEVHWDIDKAILDYKIVKLSIQPLIENSIYHGIKPKKEKGTIFISGYAYEGYIIIQIKDDGIGLPQEEVELLNTEMRKDYIKEDTHIGIMNVNQRIKLLFGEEYGLIVQSEYKKFTAVKIIIPMVE